MRVHLLLSLWLPLTPVPAGSAAVAAAPFPAGSGVLAAAGVLHEWDARRADAWAAGSTADLRALYTDGSATGAADVRLLRAYGARHLVVRRMVTQVFALTVLERGPRHLRLGVLDRVAAGEVRDGSRIRPLGATRPARRVIDLRLVDGRWRVLAVRAVSDSAPGPRPAPTARPGR